MFNITMGKGFHLTFENKVKVSVQFGRGNYCSNNSNEDAIFFSGGFSNNYSGDVESNDAEVAVVGASDEWITKEVFKDLFNINLNDDVAPNINANDVAKIIAHCQQI